MKFVLMLILAIIISFVAQATQNQKFTNLTQVEEKFLENSQTYENAESLSNFKIS